MPIVAETLFIITAYAYGCGATGLTYMERFPHHERTIAADPAVLPLLSEVAIPGIGVRVVEDTGSGIKGKRIDVFMRTCDEARAFGRQALYVLPLKGKPFIVRKAKRTGGWNLAEYLPVENYW